MTLAYNKKQGFQIQITNIVTQKIDKLSLNTFEMVIVSFQIQDKLDKAYFFQLIFLLPDISRNIVLKMVFLL